MAQSKYWCFTHHFNEEGLKTDEVAQNIREAQDKLRAIWKSGTATYVVFQLERGKKTKRLHFQGYLELAKRGRLTGLKKILDKGTHWEKRKGTAKEAAEYCMAGPETEGGRVAGQAVQYGEISRDENLSDRKMAIKLIEEGRSLKEIAKLYPGTFLSNSNGLAKLARFWKEDESKDSKMPEVYVFWGPSGAGKSHAAAELAKRKAEELKLRICSDASFENGFLIGYQGEGVLVLNEFEGANTCGFKKLLRILDKWVYVSNTKGGETEMNARVIIFTSIGHPKNWYAVSDIQLMRRITKVFKLEEREEFEGMKWADKDEKWI